MREGFHHPVKALQLRWRRLVRAALTPASFRWAAPEIPPVPRDVLDAQGYPSQIGQDLVLDRHVFCGMRGGTFADVGAHDGETFNNSVFFERERGWTGVCIEPNPEVFTRLAASRTATCIQAAISDRPGTARFFVVTGIDMLTGLDDSYDRRHRRRAKREMAAAGSVAQQIDVIVRRLDEVLAASGIDHLDLLTVDVEGAELGVLRSIDLRALGVRAVVVENNFRSWAIGREMGRQGYQLALRIGWDELYVPR